MVRKSGGGTSVDDRGALLWIALSIGAAVVIALLLVRTGSTDKPAPDQEKAVKVVPDTPDDDLEEPPLFDEPGPGSPEPGSQEGRTDAMAELRSDLQGQRLWVELDVEPADDSRLLVRSAYCKQAAFVATINKFAGSLKTNGFATVACYERHGELIFDKAL